MEITEIIKDALNYPLSDFKKFLILGLPNLIIAIFLFVLVIQGVGISELANASGRAMSTAMVGSFLITLIVFYIVLIVCTCILSGIGISVIRETINGNDNLPDIQLGKNIVDGIKLFVVELVYVGIPTLIYFILILVSAAALGDNSGILVLIFTLIYIVFMILVAIIAPIAIGRLAQTDSISEAIDFKNVYEISNNIGLGKIIIVLVIVSLIITVVAFIGAFITIIPIIGLFIVYYIINTYVSLTVFRSFGLLYRESFNTSNPYQRMNNPVNTIPENYQTDYTNNQGSYTNNQVNYNNNQADNIPTNDHPLDYKAPEKTNVETEENTSSALKKCSECGYSNPDYANNCVNCGKKF